MTIPQLANLHLEANVGKQFVLHPATNSTWTSDTAEAKIE